MPRRCSICDHQDRKEIERILLADAKSKSAIAVQFRVTRKALLLHLTDHVRPAVLNAASVHEDLTTARIVEKLRSVADELEQTFKDTSEPVAKARVGKEVIAAWVYLGKTIGLFTNAPAQNDNRTLIINGNLDRLSVEELRALMPPPKDVL